MSSTVPRPSARRSRFASSIRSPAAARIAPFGLFIALLALQPLLDRHLDARWVVLARGLAVGALLAWLWPLYRELRQAPALRAREWVVSIAVGVGVFLAWIHLDRPWMTMGALGRWRVWFAESYDGGRTFAQVPTTGTVHHGPVCTKGDSCPWVQRQLLDDFGLALDPRTGRAAIAYSRSVEFGDYKGCRRAANCPQTYYVEERASSRSHQPSADG